MQTTNASLRLDDLSLYLHEVGSDENNYLLITTPTETIKITDIADVSWLLYELFTARLSDLKNNVSPEQQGWMSIDHENFPIKQGGKNKYLVVDAILAIFRVVLPQLDSSVPVIGYREGGIRLNITKLELSNGLRANIDDLKLQITSKDGQHSSKCVFITSDKEWVVSNEDIASLILFLALKKEEDDRRGFDRTESGWTYIEELEELLDISSIVSVILHQIMRMLIKEFPHFLKHHQIIEHRPGCCRLALPNIEIIRN